MKRICITITIIASLGLCSFVHEAYGMNAGAQARQPEGKQFEVLRKYVNLKTLFLNLGGLLAADNENDDGDELDSIRPKDFVRIFIDSVKIGQLPITIKTKNADGSLRVLNLLIKDLFKPREFKDFLKAISCDYADNSFARNRFAEYIKTLRESLRMDKIKETFGIEDYVALDGALIAAEKYYRENAGSGRIEDFISFERFPGFLGDIIRQYFYLDKLAIALNTALRKEDVSRPMLLDSFNFRPLLERTRCEPAQLPLMERGMRGMASVLITWSRSEKEGIETLFRYLGDGYEKDRENAARANAAPQQAALVAPAAQQAVIVAPRQ